MADGGADRCAVCLRPKVTGDDGIGILPERLHFVVDRRQVATDAVAKGLAYIRVREVGEIDTI